MRRRKQQIRKLIPTGPGLLRAPSPSRRVGSSARVRRLIGVTGFEPLESRRVLAAAIQVGDHQLLPDQADQQILLYVTGDMAVQGLNLNVQIADGGPEVPGGLVDGPVIQDLDILTGTIFSGNNNGTTDLDGPTLNDPTDYAPQHEVRSTTTGQDSVIADGLLAILTIDTTGFFGGRWSLRLSETVNGPTDFASLPVDIQDGSITIPSPDGPGVELLADGTLQITGTLEDDWVRIDTVAPGGPVPQLVVESNLLNEPAVFDYAAVSSIDVSVSDGSDRVFVGETVAVPISVDGGAGRDFVWGGSGNDTLRGGDGNDRLWGRAGNDLLEGGTGADRLWGEDGDDTLRGEAGLDRLWGDAGSDTLENPDGLDVLRDPDLPDPPTDPGAYDEVLTDVDASGFVTPSDVLLIINVLNDLGPQLIQGDFAERPELDVDGNGQISPADALIVINVMNAFAAGGQGEGEGPVADGTGGVLDAQITGGLTSAVQLARPVISRLAEDSSVVITQSVTTIDSEPRRNRLSPSRDQVGDQPPADHALSLGVLPVESGSIGWERLLEDLVATEPAAEREAVVDLLFRELG